jgi:hypothetical protein
VDHPVERYLLDLDRSLLDPDLVDWRRGAKLAWTRQRGLLELRVVLTVRQNPAGDQVQEPDGVEVHWVRVHEVVPDSLPYLREFKKLTPEPGGSAVAKLYVPGEVPADRLRLDVTRHPGVSPVSAASAAWFEALATGRSADIRMRRREYEEALAGWRTCASLWQKAGRTDLQALALRRASAAAMCAEDPSAAADADREAYQAAEATARPWVFEHLGRPRADVSFDADLMGPP